MAYKLTPEQAQLAQEYLPLTLWLVGKHYGKYKYFGYDAIYDAAITALMKTSRTYDETRGAKFGTFLTFAVEKELFRMVRDANAKKRKGRVISFDVVFDDDSVEDLTLLDMIGKDDNYPVFMNDATSELTDREKEAIYLKYVEEKSQTEIGERLGVSQVHASRIIRKGLNKMKERLPQ
jgi:RNA polymerase sigma factor (sigma-70 family)